jgi:membrane associated rhomboid family serine protease
MKNIFELKDWTDRIIVFNLLMFAATFIFNNLLNVDIYQYLILRLDDNFHITQLLTSTFIHANLIHILMNMLTLYFIGYDVEWNWGSKNFIYFYLVMSVVVSVITFIFTPSSVPGVLGASGVICAIFASYVYLYSDRTLHLYGIIPIKAKYLLYAFFSYELVMQLISVNDGVSHIAHLSGCLLGYLTTYVFHKQNWCVKGKFD